MARVVSGSLGYEGRKDKKDKRHLHEMARVVSGSLGYEGRSVVKDWGLKMREFAVDNAVFRRGTGILLTLGQGEFRRNM